MVAIQIVGTSPTGAIAEYSAAIGSLSKIAGVQNATPGRFISKFANGSAGGIPVAGFQRFVIFSPSASLLPTYAEVRYSLPASPAAPVGSITEYFATIGSLTKISGAQNTTPGRLPYRPQTILAPFVLGHFRCPLNATWLISTTGATPAVQLPVGIIVRVSC